MKQIKLFRKQLEFYNIKGREALLEAGIAYGKSRVASLWLASQTQIHPGTKWIMAARDYRQLKTAIDAEFEYYLNDLLGMQRNVDYTKTNGSPIEYHFIKSNSRIYGFGAKNYETAFRAGNYSGAWGDEVDFWAPEAVTRLRGRIRVFPELVRWTSSPFGFNHVYDDFYVKKIGPVINAPTHENPTLSLEYISSLEKTYSARFYRQEVLAERLNIQDGGIYYSFKRDVHVKECEYNNIYPIWVGMDFNVNPMTAVVGQIINSKLYIIDEFYLLSSNTPAMCKAILSKYGHNVLVVPDYTGGKMTTNASLSDLQILKQHGFTVKASPNPYRVDRYASVNGALEKGMVVISPRCKYTIKDLESVSYKEGTDLPDTTDKMLTHISDALGYLVFKTINPLRGPSSPISSQRR